jgi:hypothetical protein
MIGKREQPSGYATATLAPSKGRLMRCTVDGLTPNRSAMTHMPGRPSEQPGPFRLLVTATDQAMAIVKLTMPGNWVDAVLTFQTSSQAELIQCDEQAREAIRPFFMQLDGSGASAGLWLCSLPRQRSAWLPVTRPDEGTLQFVVGRGQLRHRLRYGANACGQLGVLNSCFEACLEVKHLLVQHLYFPINICPSRSLLVRA